ncbi:MAG: hypothetical protein KC583_17670 [Myxococcales bacterium]|nr:hypothetical protein [Myxococcales bacterium]
MSTKNLRDAFPTLDRLFDGMRERDPRLNDERVWTSLPTYGGAAPASTVGVWSWDEQRLIVGSCADDIALVKRSDW